MNLVNLTPHAITLRAEDGTETVIAASGTLARVEQTFETRDSVAGFPVAKATFGDVQGIPEPVEGSVFVVSALVLGATKRSDVVAPDTSPNGGAVRNEKGQVIAVTRLLSAL